MHPDNTHTGHIPGDMPGTGKILIANPFLKDPNFLRSVILLCEHQEEGSFGFILNKLFDHTLDELFPDTTLKKIPVYFGGPVQLDTLHFIHRKPDLIEGGRMILPGIYWGGDFERVMDLLNSGVTDEESIKFFAGYSGWGSGQLEDELKEESWIVSRGTRQLLFHESEQNIWARSLHDLGDDFARMANYPIDPSLN